MAITDLVQNLYSETTQDTVYHYTSLNGVLGIVEGGYLRASNIRYLNDATEMSHFSELFWNAITKRQNGSPLSLEFFRQLQAWVSERLTSGLGHKLHVVCFTTNGNLLSQWRSYCPIAKGVSLGFRPDKILSVATEQSFQVGKCLYDPQTKQQLAERIFKTIEEVALQRGEETDLSMRHPLNSFYDVFEKFEDDLLRVAALFKHPAFHEEQEWRAISSAVKNYVEAPIEYHEGPSTLVPFVKFHLPKAHDRRLDIEHMFLGPTPSVSNSMHSLSNYLAKQGASPRTGLQYCQIPYRTW